MAPKWARQAAPFLEPMEAISVAVLKQVSMELEGQNWVPQKLRPKIGANFWAPLLIPFAYRVMLFQNTLIQRARSGLNMGGPHDETVFRT